MILLDAGLVTELDAADRRNFLDLFTAVAVGDGRLAAQLMIERSRYGRPKTGLHPAATLLLTVCARGRSVLAAGRR